MDPQSIGSFRLVLHSIELVFLFQWGELEFLFLLFISEPLDLPHQPWDSSVEIVLVLGVGEKEIEVAIGVGPLRRCLAKRGPTTNVCRVIMITGCHLVCNRQPTSHVCAASTDTTTVRHRASAVSGATVMSTHFPG